MRFVRFASIFALVAVAACGGSNTRNDKEDGGGGLPDGFITEGCTTASDCDDGDPCTEDRCTNKKCTFRAKDCSEAANGCNTGACDPSDGSCYAEPANDDAACVTTDDEPGTCSDGLCQKAPQCDDSGYLSCSYTPTDDNTTSGASVISDYACVQGLTGPEYAYSFYASQDKHLKITLTSTADLDLVLLKGTKCVASAECIKAASTAGSGNEVLEADVKSGEDYMIVVDGRNGAKGAYTIAIECIGCMPKQALTCNQSVMGDTTSATASSTVGGLYCMEGMGGPEEVYTVEVTEGQRFKVTLSGASTEHDLIAFADEDGQCADAYCSEYSVNDNPMNDTVTLQTDEYSTTNKWSVVVDARSTGGTYMLSVDCPPTCNPQAGSFTCSTGKITTRNDDTKSTNVLDTYSCVGATGLTGSEMIYEFSPYDDGDYTFELTGLDANLDLIVVEGDGYWSSATCDPTGLCIASSQNTGTTSESVTFTADSLKMYYIIVDGKGGAAGNYSLKVSSTECGSPSCLTSPINKLGCTYRTDSRKNNDVLKSRNLIDTWACGTDMTGSEVIYQLPIEADGTYNVELLNAPTGLNLFVLKGLSYECTPSTTCEPVTNKKATITATAGDYYYAIVDGKSGLNDADYTIQLTSTACGAAKCVNPYKSLDCSITKTLSGRNDGAGATRNVNSWSCSTSDKYTAAEQVHYFDPPKAGLYTVQLAGLNADLDLMVIEADDSTCKADAPCATTTMGGTTKAISHNENPAMDGEKVNFYAKTGKKYFFVIDGYAPAGEEVASDYVIFISSCAP